MKEKEELKASEQNSKLDAIKHLIFGENMIEYDSAFVEIKKDVDDKNKLLKGYVDNVKENLEKHFDSIIAEINLKLQDLESQVENKMEAIEEKKIDKKQLSKLLVNIGEKIGN